MKENDNLRTLGFAHFPATLEHLYPVFWIVEVPSGSPQNWPPDPVVNRLAAEVALCLENLHLETITWQHWRNIINIEADALSRLQEGYSVPAPRSCTFSTAPRAH